MADSQFVDRGKFIKYIQTVANERPTKTLFFEGDATAATFKGLLEGETNRYYINQFLTNPEIKTLYVRRHFSEDNTENDDEGLCVLCLCV